MSCQSCKKKKPVEKLEPIIEEKELIGFIPTNEDIKLAYAELSSYGNISDEKKEFINKIYRYLFLEEFDFKCGSCASQQARKFKNFIINDLKIDI